MSKAEPPSRRDAEPSSAPPSRRAVRIGVLTVSDACSRGDRTDISGETIVHWAESRGDTVAARKLVPDETVEIVRALLELCDDTECDAVLTTGGTGLTARDITPEATRTVLEREAPGIAEALRASVLPRFPRAALSRGLAGVRGKTLIVNLPGSPGGVADGLAVLEQWLEHAVALLRGEPTDH